MAIDINFIKHDDYLEVKAIGSFDLDISIGKFIEILNICHLANTSKIMIDYRKLHINTSGTDKVLYALGTEDAYVKYLQAGGREMQIAYLSPNVQSYEPGADIAKKVPRLKTELFDNPNEALAWLDIK